MIVHVYNPERILNNASPKVTNNKSSSAVNKQALNVVRQDPNVNRPPPSPKLLRQSGFKGFYSKSFQSSQSNGQLIQSKKRIRLSACIVWVENSPVS